ncbi:MAG: hypothetical protein ACOYN5_01235 [Bacteroidales bacterium]
MKRFLITIVFSISFSVIPLSELIAQIDLNDTVENMIIYNHERFGQAIAHNLGLGFGYRAGKNISAFQTRFFSAEIVTMRSLKQIKIYNPYPNTDARRYVYGKLNEVINLRSGFGFRKLINGKPYWGGIELRWIYEIGASLAIEKPYYLFVYKAVPINGGYDYVIETTKFDANTSYDNIYGRAPFTKGLNELSLVPGVYFRSGFSFEFGEVKTSIKALEAGALIEAFPGGLTIMAENTNQPLFVNFYIAFSFGKRFNKY